MKALRYVATRVVWAAVLVFCVTTLSFMIVHVLPGDPARMLVGPQASAQDAAHAREVYGLDAPLRVTLVKYWTRLVHRGGAAEGDPVKAKEHKSCARTGIGLHLDLGYSFHYRKPVTQLLAAKIPRSVELALGALAIQIVLGVGAGIFAAARRGTRWDEITTSAALLGASAPTFLLGLFLQYLLAYKLQLLPYDGYGSTPAQHLRSLVLPALTLGVFGSALYTRLVRDELGGLLRHDFIRTARAKGASEARTLFVHALRNTLAPIATLVALDLGTLVGGAIVTEKLFRWPGVGEMAVIALLNRDGPVISATVLFSSTAVVLSTLALDLVHVALDPRLRRGA